MSLSQSPSIVTNGLVFAYDQSSYRSYKGPAVQNLANGINIISTGTTTGYSSTGTTEVVNIPGLGPTNTYKNTIQNNYTSFTPNSTNCCPSLHGWGGITVSPSTLYTYLILYKCDSGYTHPNYMYRYEYTSNGGSYVTEGGVHNDSNRVHLGGNWYYAWGTFTTQATTNWLGHCAAFYYRYSNIADRLTVAKVAIIPGNYTGLHPKYWPNPASTRTGAQVITDLTGNNTITANSLTYNSDGTFSFNGVNNYMTANWAGVNTTAGGYNTVCQWLYWTGQSGGFPINFSSGYRLFMPSGYLGFNNGQSDCYGVDISAYTNKWVYVVSVFYNGLYTNNSQMYLNGVLQTLTQSNGSATSGTVSTSGTIGGFSDGSYPWPGKIDQTFIYNRQLTADEVKQNFNASRGRYGI